VWQYDIPSYVLRQRERIVLGNDEAIVGRAALPGGGFVEAASADDGKRTIIRTGRTKAERVIGIFDGVLIGLATDERWIAVVSRRDGNSHVALLDPATGRVRVGIMLEGSVARVRLQVEHLLAFDDAGRIVVADLDRGCVLRDLRI
jgi:hypothetical protein